jgi:2-oxoglutarate dehydrogenase complex dehydrogenase (E1) component-like enzyme
MGAWRHISHWIWRELLAGQELKFMGRPASGSPAVGSARYHVREQEEITRRAMSKG